MKKKLLFLLSFSFISSFLFAKIEKPVSWSHSVEKVNEETFILHFKAEIQKGWHVYSAYLKEGGPLPTYVSFTESEKYALVGELFESQNLEKKYDDIFEMEVLYFSHTMQVSQKVEKKTPDAFLIHGEIEYSVCDSTKCLPPEIVEVEFSIPKTEKKATVTPSKNKNREKGVGEKENVQEKSTLSAKNKESTKKKNKKTLWGIFVGGFLGGLLALLTPCVFPMLPLTISYFTKQTKNKFYPLIYGVSIIVIYVLLGFLITVLFGADALNSLASNGIVNFLFFIVFILFALSFLGLFEITLPSKWVNSADKKADKGGIIGVFFMAFTLGLVSFSCTGPIIGTLLVEASVLGESTGPIVGMFGFSFALALPFTLLSYFPKVLSSLPKSGGWLQTVKVVLGFLELGLALKFLSNVDLAYHWKFLDREVFLVLWIAIGCFLTLYLAGKLRLEKDPPLNGVGSIRICFAIISLAFTTYLLPGLWGAPLKAVSGFLPPEQTQDFNLNSINTEKSHSNIKEKKYGGIFECPHNLNCFFDYEEALSVAKKENKPLFIDFTGWTCVNCRKMEAEVWSDKSVHSLLDENFILVSLYVDDKTDLPENEKYTSATTGKKIKRVGQKWADFQISKFESNSQPYYIILSHEEEILEGPRGYNSNIKEYVDFLENGIFKFKESELQ